MDNNIKLLSNAIIHILKRAKFEIQNGSELGGMALSTNDVRVTFITNSSKAVVTCLLPSTVSMDKICFESAQNLLFPEDEQGNRSIELEWLKKYTFKTSCVGHCFVLVIELK